MQVLYHGPKLMLGSQVKMVDEARSLVFDEQLVEPATMSASLRLEGVWWLQSAQSEMLLALSNTTDAPLAVEARVDAVAPPQREPLTLTLAPHETRLLKLPRDINEHQGGTLAQVGGVSLGHTGTPGALLARAFISQPETGFSSSVQFIDPGRAKSARLHGAGLRLGRVSGEELMPVIVARNIGDADTVVTGRIPYAASDGSMAALTLPQLRLRAGETKQFRLPAALRSGQLTRGWKSAGLEFEYEGRPGSVVMAAQSVSSGGDQVFRVPLSDPTGIPSGTGGYAWRIAGNSATTIVYLKNLTGEPRQYKLQLRYPGGVYSLGLKTIEAGQTMMFDVHALRDNQVPDAQGQTIPLDAFEGQVHWSEHSPTSSLIPSSMCLNFELIGAEYRRKAATHA